MVKNFAAYPHFFGENLWKCLCIKGFGEVRVGGNPSLVPSLVPSLGTSSGAGVNPCCMSEGRVRVRMRVK